MRAGRAGQPRIPRALKRHTGVDDTTLVMVDIWTPAAMVRRKTAPGGSPGRFASADPTRPTTGMSATSRALPGRRSEHHAGDPGRGVRPLALASGRGQLRRRPGGRLRIDIMPLEITQPEGPSFEVEGYQVRWQKWSFVIGFNAREGLTLHHLRDHDEGRDRSILYRASLTEMVVPYGDPGATQRRKNAFDVGEYGMGMCANSLELGCDCLGLIRYFDAHLCDSRGEPLSIKNAICMHEEDYGILWKHTDRRLPESPQVRRSRRLVVSSISTVENYEYGFFWYLYQDGTIQFEVKLTGILSLGDFPPGRCQPTASSSPPSFMRKSSAFLQHAPCLRPRRHCQHRLSDLLKFRFLTPPDQIASRYSLGCDCRSCLASTFRPAGVSIFSASSFSSRCSAS